MTSQNTRLRDSCRLAHASYRHTSGKTYENPFYEASTIPERELFYAEADAAKIQRLLATFR